MFIVGPDGKETTDYIEVFGQDSDSFQKAVREARQRLMDFVEKQGKEAKQTPAYVEHLVDSNRRQQAALVKSWSFDEPCNSANVLEFLTEAPDVAQQIDAFAADRGKFVAI
jgi:hypothetical protein